MIGYISRDMTIRYVSKCLGRIARKPIEIEAWLWRITDRKWHMSRDRWLHPERLRSSPPICLWPIIYTMAVDTDFIAKDGRPTGAHRESCGHVTNDVTWLWKVRVVTQYAYCPISPSKTAGDKGSVPKDHQYEMACGKSNRNVTDDVT